MATRSATKKESKLNDILEARNAIEQTEPGTLWDCRTVPLNIEDIIDRGKATPDVSDMPSLFGQRVPQSKNERLNHLNDPITMRQFLDENIQYHACPAKVPSAYSEADMATYQEYDVPMVMNAWVETPKTAESDCPWFRAQNELADEVDNRFKGKDAVVRHTVEWILPEYISLEADVRAFYSSNILHRVVDLWNSSILPVYALESDATRDGAKWRLDVTAESRTVENRQFAVDLTVVVQLVDKKGLKIMNDKGPNPSHFVVLIELKNHDHNSHMKIIRNKFLEQGAKDISFSVLTTSASERVRRNFCQVRKYMIETKTPYSILYDGYISVAMVWDRLKSWPPVHGEDSLDDPESSEANLQRPGRNYDEKVSVFKTMHGVKLSIGYNYKDDKCPETARRQLFRLIHMSLVDLGIMPAPDALKQKIDQVIAERPPPQVKDDGNVDPGTSESKGEKSGIEKGKEDTSSDHEDVLTSKLGDLRI